MNTTFNPILVLFSHPFEKPEGLKQLSFNPILVLFSLMLPELCITRLPYFQSYIGSIFSILWKSRIYMQTPSFQSYIGSIFSQGYGFAYPIANYFQSYIGSIFSWRRLCCMVWQDSFNPILVLFSLLIASKFKNFNFLSILYWFYFLYTS